MHRSRTISVAVAVGVLLAGVAIAAHFSGLLNPLYHRLGWHSLMRVAQEGADPNPATANLDEHAGHSGMKMPGMDMPEMEMPKGEESTSDENASKLPGYATVTIVPERQQLIGVRVGKVERGKLLMSIRAVGVIEPDQTRLARIQTRISGWVTKLYVDFVGQEVKKGAPLLEIYSPELLATQSEYLIGRSRQEIPGGGATGQNNLADLGRRKLELYGVAPEEIEELERTGKPRDALLLRSPIDGRVLERDVQEGSYVERETVLYRIADLSVVWLQAKIYEYEIPHIEVGQPVTVRLQSAPDVSLQGKVKFIEPIVQEATRTIKVRVEIDNAEELLKPGMYADLIIEHDMGEGLLVPESAVLRTGERAICFRSLPDSRFEPVEVELGSRFGDRFEVRSGLTEGDQIVISAGFLIDSESRLKATTSGAAGGHKHGG